MMNSRISMTGSLGRVKKGPRAAPLSWKVRNTLRFNFLMWFFYVKLAKLFSKVTKFPTLTSELRIRAKLNGEWIDYGVVGYRSITTAFVNYLRDDLANAAGGADVSTFKYHECGTGSTAENITDTALVTPCTTTLNPDSTRAVGTQANGVSKTYSSVGTLTFDGSAAVVEHGLFSAASTGTLMDRTVFTVINVGSGDSIQFTYTLTLNDGG